MTSIGTLKQNLATGLFRNFCSKMAVIDGVHAFWCTTPKSLSERPTPLQTCSVFVKMGDKIVKKEFDVSNEKDLSTIEGRERFSLEVSRAFQKIKLEEIERRIEREDTALKEIDDDANVFGLKNYDPRNLELYNMLTALEAKLRKLVEHAFRNDPKWWKHNIPGDVRKRADENFDLEEEFRKEYSERSFRRVEFLDFRDYYEIIINGNNEEYFFSKKIFPSKNFLLTRLSELAPMRNIIVHRPPLEENDAKRFRLFYKELTDYIDKFLMDGS